MNVNDFITHCATHFDDVVVVSKIRDEAQPDFDLSIVCKCVVIDYDILLQFDMQENCVVVSSIHSRQTKLHRVFTCNDEFDLSLIFDFASFDI